MSGAIRWSALSGTALLAVLTQGATPVRERDAVIRAVAAETRRVVAPDTTHFWYMSPADSGLTFPLASLTGNRGVVVPDPSAACPFAGVTSSRLGYVVSVRMTPVHRDTVNVGVSFRCVGGSSLNGGYHLSRAFKVYRAGALWVARWLAIVET